MRLYGRRIDQDLLDAEVGEGGIVGICLVVQRDRDLVDDLVATLLPYVRADESRLVPMDVMPTQDVFDRLDARLNRRLVVGRAILAQKVLKDVGGNDGIPLDRLHQVLADNQPRKMLVDLVVKRGHWVPNQKSKSLPKLRLSR